MSRFVIVLAVEKQNDTICISVDQNQRVQVSSTTGAALSFDKIMSLCSEPRSFDDNKLKSIERWTNDDPGSPYT